jgi:hypothetical protein
MRTSLDETWEEYHKRMLRETARFIEWGLAHPDEAIEIPAKPADEGSFPAPAARWFWGVVLAERTSATIERWREILRRRPRGMFFKRKK